jgi:DNA-binding GntR family transcriptional regulator
VKKINEKSIKELFEVREMIEVGVVAKIAKDITDEQLEQLKEVLDLRSQAFKARNDEVIKETDTHFHRLLVHFGGNEKLEALFESVLLQSNGVFFGLTDELPFYENTVRKYLEAASHTKIFNALKARNASKAVRLIKKHLAIGRVCALKTCEFLGELDQLS